MDPVTAAQMLVPVVATGLVAVIAWVTGRRLAFVCGTAACWMAVLAPRPRVYAEYSSLEGAYMSSFRDAWAISRDTAPIAAVIGVVAGLLNSEFLARKQPNTRVGSLPPATTAN